MALPSIEGDLGVKSDIGIILPTYCEAASINKLILEIESLKVSTSILVVDDSSPDGTANMVRVTQRKYDNVLLFVRPAKLGLATAITDGFKAFLSMPHPPDYIVTMDADYSHSPRDVPRLISAAKKGKGLAVGSRYCESGEVVNRSLTRYGISRVGNLLASLIAHAEVKDCTSGFRCYSTRVVRHIVPALHGGGIYEMQVESIRLAASMGFQVEEIPITFSNRRKGKSKLATNEIAGFLQYLAQASPRGLMSVSPVTGIRSALRDGKRLLEEAIDRIITGQRVVRLFADVLYRILHFSMLGN